MIIRMTAKPEYDRNQYGYIIVPVTKEMNAEAESRALVSVLSPGLSAMAWGTESVISARSLSGMQSEE